MTLAHQLAEIALGVITGVLAYISMSVIAGIGAFIILVAFYRAFTVAIESIDPAAGPPDVDDYLNVRRGRRGWRVLCERPSGPPQRDRWVFGAYRRVERTPIEIVDWDEKCRVCGDVSGPAYRYTRHIDYVAFGVTLYSEMASDGPYAGDGATDEMPEWVGAGSCECLVCLIADPIDIDLGRFDPAGFKHGHDNAADDPESALQDYGRRYDEWLGDRIPRVDTERKRLQKAQVRQREEIESMKESVSVSGRFSDMLAPHTAEIAETWEREQRLREYVKEMHRYRTAIYNAETMYEHPDAIAARLGVGEGAVADTDTDAE